VYKTHDNEMRDKKLVQYKSNKIINKSLIVKYKL